MKLLLSFSVAAQILGIGACLSQTQPNNPFNYPAAFQIVQAGNAAYLLREDDNMLMYCYFDNLGSGTLPAKCATPFKLPAEVSGQFVSYRIDSSNSVGGMLHVISTMGGYRLCQGTTTTVSCGPERQVPPF